MVGRPTRRSGSGLVALPEYPEWPEALPEVPVWPEALPEVRELSVVPPGGQGVVGSPSRRSRSGREAIPEVWEWSRRPPGCSRVVIRISRRSRSGRDTLAEVREWSGVVGRPSRKFGSGREALP